MTIETHERALRIAERYGLCIYDALIVSAALLANCKTLHSEDMQNGQLLERQLTIRNPFTHRELLEVQLGIGWAMSRFAKTVSFAARYSTS